MKIFQLWKITATWKISSQHRRRLFQNLQSQDNTYLIYLRDLLIFITAVFIFIILLKSGDEGSFYNPFPEKELFEIQGYILSDSSPVGIGKYIHKMRINNVLSRKGITVFTDNEIRIITLKGPFNWGDSVLLKNIEKIQGNLYSGRIKTAQKSESFFFKTRRAVKAFFDRKFKETGSDDGLTRALITGDRKELSAHDSLVFRRSGCSHLLALSGMHLGIISLFFYFLIKPVSGVKSALLSVNIINILYLFISGFSPSLLRACILSGALSIAKLTGRKAPLSRLLFLTFLINISLTPDYINDLSFQYSYLALTGIILFAKPLYRILLIYFPPLLAVPLSCSLSAQFFTAPLSAFVFGEVFPSGIIASVVITPVLTIFMWVGLIALFIPSAAFFYPAAAGLHFVNNILSSLITNTASFFAIFPPVRFNPVSLTVLIIFNLSVMIILTVPNPGLKLFKRYR